MAVIFAAGYTSSTSDGDITGGHGNHDFWLVKISNAGVLQWQKCLGGSAGDEANSIQQTTDGGYIAAGFAYSANGDVTNNHGQQDMWIVKLYGTSSVDAINVQEGISLSPNPASDELTIDLKSATDEPVTITIVDQFGRLISTKTISAYTGAHTENITGLVPGVYMLDVAAGTAKRKAMFVKK